MTAARLPRPVSTSDLLPSEMKFISALQNLEFGYFEVLRIRNRELVTEPWPTAVRLVTFGTGAARNSPVPAEFKLKQPIAEFLGYVRGVEDGEIRHLKFRRGLPVSMEIVERKALT